MLTAAVLPRELIIIGAGGLGRETAQTAGALSGVGEPWRLLGFLDDDPGLTGGAVSGIPVLGPSAAVHSTPLARVLLCVGGPHDHLSRMRLARRLDLPEQRYATLVHPDASAGADSLIGPGTVLHAQSVLTAAVRVGAHVVVMPRAVLAHDVVVEDYATLAAGAVLGGGARIGRGAYLGAGAMVREYVTVGAGSVVGMGSVVLQDIPAGQVWAGNPARFLRRLLPPDDRDPLAASLGRGEAWH